MHSSKKFFLCSESIGSRFGCLHPLTSYRLYQTLCIPILYGAEIWTLSKAKLNMLERVLSRSNLAPEVNCPPEASYFEVNRPLLKLFAPPPNPLPPSEGSRAKDT